MRWLLDLIYLGLALVTSPIWLARLIRTGKIRTDWPGRLGKARISSPARQRILVHAVSVGEVNAVRLLVEQLAESRGRPEVVIATTTNTGFARAESLFGSRHEVVRYPLDLSFAVERFLRRVRPDVVALVELEVWPNFTAACARRGIGVCVVNGRLSARSHRRYLRLGPLIRPSFRRLARVAVQSEAYAGRFAALGVGADDVEVTGTMKWDTAEISDHVEGAADLATAMGIDRGRPLIVGGSTEPGEPELLAAAVPDGAQLLCAPRKPEWFEAAAAALPGCARRSRGECGSETGRFLLDTIGELRLAYALADLVVVGRTFGSLHGSDMMEPVALGKATIVGPAVADFQEIVESLRAGDGLVQTDRAGLPAIVRELLADPGRRRKLADGGRAVIRAQQGATSRHVKLILSLLKGEDATEPNSPPRR